MTVMGCWTYNYILESFHDAITRLFLKRVNCKQLCCIFGDSTVAFYFTIVICLFFQREGIVWWPVLSQSG